MKLALIGDGNSIHIVRWAEWFHAKGHEVQMISLTRLTNPSKAFNRYCEVPVLKGPFAYLRRILPIRDVVAAWRPDIVHGHYLTSGGFYASMSGCKKVVVSAWGSDVYSDSKNKYKRWCIKYALNHATMVHGDSEHIVKAVKGLAPGIETRKILFGIDTDKFKPEPISHDKFRFLSIRATSPIYNPMIIVQAFEMSNLDAYLWMPKPSIECQNVKDYVDGNPELKERVVWVDRLTYDEMPKLYNSVDVGISIPNWDSNSTAVMECMACGVPVIASEIEQNHELIDGGISGVFTGSSAEELMDKMMLSMLMHSEVGKRARESILRNGSYPVEMTKAEKMYEDVLEG